MDKERILAEYLGYTREADAGGNMGGGYIYRETTVEVMDAAMRFVVYQGARNQGEAAKALAILKSHDWRNDVLPFSYSQRMVSWAELEDVRLDPPDPDDPYGRLRFTFPQHGVLDRLTHMAVELYFLEEDRPQFQQLRETALELMAAHQGERPAEPAHEGGLGLNLHRDRGPSAADLEALEKLAALHEKGVLSDDEFATAKARLLK
jgi:hypothetical protein